jgi:hypothetical protein
MEETVSDRKVYETWRHWPVNWSAVIVGVLSTMAIALIVTLVAVAVGAHNLDPTVRVVDVKKISLTAMIISVASAFFAFVVGGWVAGKIAGIFRSEHAMLHGAIVWLVALPVIGLFATLGAAGYAGTWYAGMAAQQNGSYYATPYTQPETLSANATADEVSRNQAAWTEYRKNVAQWREETPKANRNGALLAITTMMLGLMGSVLGGWMASGEDMNFSHVKNRKPVTV